MTWVDLGLPCPICAVDIGPHLHSLRDDGSLGILVAMPHQYEDFGIDLADVPSGHFDLNELT